MKKSRRRVGRKVDPTKTRAYTGEIHPIIAKVHVPPSCAYRIPQVRRNVTVQRINCVCLGPWDLEKRGCLFPKPMISALSALGSRLNLTEPRHEDQITYGMHCI